MIQKRNVRIIVLAVTMLLILPIVAFTNVSAHSGDVIASEWTSYPHKIDAVL
mgnify:CR=1 FL=1